MLGSRWRSGAETSRPLDCVRALTFRVPAAQRLVGHPVPPTAVATSVESLLIVTLVTSGTAYVGPHTVLAIAIGVLPIAFGPMLFCDSVGMGALALLSH